MLQHYRESGTTTSPWQWAAQSLRCQGTQGSAEEIILGKCSILRIPTSCYLCWVRHIPWSNPAFS